MYKRVILFVLLFFVAATPVYAHLTGAFADFLSVVYDKATISKLELEMDETKREIEELTPQIESAEARFHEHQQAAVEQLQFFADVGLDTSLALIEQGADIVDLLGSQWLMEYKIEHYLSELNELYLQFQQLHLQQQTMQGHSALLKAIEKNIAAREVYLKAAEGLELETIANYLDIDWTSEVEYKLIADLQRDQQTIEQAFNEWLSFTPAGNVLHESWLNKHSNAIYYFRQDHIYIEYMINAEHVLLLGQVLQNEAQTGAQLIIEAGFYNGFFLPEELLVELPGFTLSYDAITTEAQIEAPYVVQQNGQLQIQGK